MNKYNIGKSLLILSIFLTIITPLKSIALTSAFGTNTNTTSFVSFSSMIDTLRERMNVQTVLNNVMTPSPNLVVDGVLGKKSIQAVQAFQEKRGIVADGKMGPITRSHLENAQTNTDNNQTNTNTSTPTECGPGVLYSYKTGKLCEIATSDLPTGCTSATLFSPITGVSCAVKSTSCGMGYQLSNNTCVPITCSGLSTSSCTISNGKGTQSRTCNSGTWSSYRTCTLTSCNTGYKQSSNTCVSSTDTTKPVITSFSIPTTSTSLSIPISSLSGTDNVSLTGYILTESGTVPLSTSFTTVKPTTYTFTSSGTKYLYAWVKDSSGNISTSINRTVTITIPVTTCSGSTTASCTITNGVGSQSRTCTNGTWSSYGTCSLSSCGSGYTQSGNSCVAASCFGSTTQSCSITNGTGTQSRTCSLGTWSTYGTCSLSSCNSGYKQSGNTCVSSTDTTKPIITSFSIPTTSTSLTIPISSLSGTDNVSLTGYLLTESSSTPSASSGSWTTTKPTTYTFTSSGTKYLYAWVKDSSGNISLSINRTVTITIPVTTCSGSTTASCTITNGTGSQSRTCSLGTWSGYGACSLSSCNSGYIQSGNACVATVVTTAPVIGDIYGGGKVAYILQAGNPGYDATKVKGLIASLSNIGSGVKWYNGSNITTGATGTALGTGLANTNAIVASQGTPYSNYAAGLARTYNGGGYTDWYLPSKDELHKLYLNHVAIGTAWDVGYGNMNYWSSSEFNSANAWYEYWGGGQDNSAGKSPVSQVRPIRSFEITATGTTKTTATCSGSTTTSCSISNGIGTQSRTCTNGAWVLTGSCTLSSCNSGYQASGDSCVAVVVTTPTIPSNTNYLRTFYISSSTGNDSNTGTSKSTPWKTISKVNSQTFKAGDGILFKSGDTWHESLTFNAAGSSSLPITYGSYDTGNKPIMNGFTTVTGWTSEGNGIYSKNISTESEPNIITIDGVNTPMGRWPDTGWMIVDSHSGKASITDSSLSNSPSNWSGGELVLRPYWWVTDRNKITSQSGNTIYYTSSSNYNAMDGNGYFIQKHVGTLNKIGEWAYVNSKLSMYFGSDNPNNHIIKIPTLDEFAYVHLKNYIKFDNLHITGYNDFAVNAHDSSYVTLTNSVLDYIGNAGFKSQGWGTSDHAVIENNSFDNINNNAIRFSGNSTNETIQYNTITNIGTISGLSGSGDGSGEGIDSYGNNSIIKYNIIRNIGYNGITFGGANTIVSNNFVDTFCVNKDDGAGIYTYEDSNTGKQITNNIVINGVGAAEGTVLSKEMRAHGIYIDGADNTLISGNTIYHNYGAGIFINTQSLNMNIQNNTVFDNAETGIQIISNLKGGGSIKNMNMQNNIFFAKDASQKILYYVTTLGDSDVTQLGTVNNNYYTRPINETGAFKTEINAWNGPATSRTLASWQSYSGLDLNSKKATKTITNTSDLRFEYNPTNINKTISLGANYIDVKNTLYPGSITLAPWSSAVLIKSTSNTTSDIIPPVITAFTIPTTSTSLTISITSLLATDNVGVTGYLLTETSTKPSAGVSGWSMSTPSYTFSSSGTKYLYAWAKDATGNVSTSINKSVVITLPVVAPPSTGSYDRIIEGTTTNNTTTGVWNGVNIERSSPVKLAYRNNSITSVNSGGYMLQAGDESTTSYNNNLDGEVVTGNKLTWNGTDTTSITHGLFVGYNVNSIVKYNYLNKVPYGIIFKSGTPTGQNMTFTSGGAAYNIVKNGKFAIRMKGINGVGVYNNTFYNDLYNGSWYMILITENMDQAAGSPSLGAKIKNNIFYTKYPMPAIKIESGSFANFESDYNVYYCESCTNHEPTFIVDNVAVSWTKWRSMGYDTHSVIVHPNFIDAINFVPSTRLNYGTNLGTTWQTGLSNNATWTVGSSPATTNQNGTWQVGARISSVLGASTYNFTLDLKLGTKGDDVKELQNILISNGYLSGTADGIFGILTLNGVKEYQKANGLKVDGKIGPKTLEILNK